METLDPVYEHLGTARQEFSCCDTEFVVQASGLRAGAAVRVARQTAELLETQFNAFSAESAVSQLNREGVLTHEHVARVVRRGLEYYDRTDGVFDIQQGQTERSVKRFLWGDDDSLRVQFDRGTVEVEGDRVSTDCRLDINGLAKGYIVDRAASALDGIGRQGFVSGGGDMSAPTGPIAVENPAGGRPLRTLETDWCVATSAGHRRSRGDVDHIYDPTAERVGSRHDSVTVLARRDCMEADALATTLAATPLASARSLAEEWGGLEALIVHEGVFYTTEGFDDHVAGT